MIWMCYFWVQTRSVNWGAYTYCEYELYLHQYYSMSFVGQCVKEIFSKLNDGIFGAYCRVRVAAALAPNFHSLIDCRCPHRSQRPPSFRHFFRCCSQHLYFLHVAINEMDYAALKMLVEWIFSSLCHCHFALQLMLPPHYSYQCWLDCFAAIAMSLLLSSILFHLPLSHRQQFRFKPNCFLFLLLSPRQILFHVKIHRIQFNSINFMYCTGMELLTRNDLTHNNTFNQLKREIPYKMFWVFSVGSFFFFRCLYFGSLRR